MEPSGADKGFFQNAPVLKNQALEDESFKRCFNLFLSRQVISEAGPEVLSLGKDVLSDQVFAWVTDAERNKPYIKGCGRDAFGRWKGDLVTGEGWRNLKDFSIAKGMVATGYDTISTYGPYSRPLQFLRTHLWVGSCANVGCPSAMQDGAACLLRRHLSHPELRAALSADEKKVFENAYRRLTSRQPGFAWTSGQWMTERTGGSDVSLTETVAHRNTSATGEGLADKEDQIPLGPWAINGFKWFSSATDSEMTIMLARTPAGGLSTFFAPTRKHNPNATTATGEPDPDGQTLNGIRIQRLKNKFGTQALPTAELVLENTRGWLIGQQGQGVQEISSILTLTRIHSTVAAVGGVGRGLAIARAYSLVREVGAGNKTRMKLLDSPLHMRTLAKLSAEYHRLMLVTFYASYILGVSEHGSVSPNASHTLEILTPPEKLIEPLLRIMAQLVKAYVCKASVALLFSCMEALGGVGYLYNEEQEHLNISRVFRDTCVLPIWEGTTDVLCTDLIRALKHPRGGRDCVTALEQVVRQVSRFGSKVDRPRGWDPERIWTSWRARLEGASAGELMGEAREIVWALGDLLVGLLLFVDAGSDGSVVVREMLVRLLEEKGEIERRGRGSSADELGMDLRIVFGVEGGSRVNGKL